MNINDLDGAAHMALFIRVCLNIIRQNQGKKGSMAVKRRGAAWNGDFRSELLFGQLSCKVESRPASELDGYCFKL